MKPYLDLKAIDVSLPANMPIKSGGTAYYRLPDDLFKFFTLCQEKYGIMGFEWDGTRNFGVVLVNPFNK